jgi:putative transposase
METDSPSILDIIPEEILAKLASHVKKPSDISGPNGVYQQMIKAIMERATHAELTDHLGYEKNATEGRGSGNSRNGRSRKSLQGDFGKIDLDMPRDRNGTFEPVLVPKHSRRYEGFDDAILSLYAKGMTTRDISSTLKELYKVEVSHTLISEVTEAVEQEVREWQNQPLDETYPIVWLDGLRIKIHHDGVVATKVAYIALAVDEDGNKNVLGIWIAETEGARFWAQVCAELRNRGVTDVYIFCVDGLKGFADAISASFPYAEIQGCMVHKVRASLRFVPFKDSKAVARDLKWIYSAPSEQEGLERLNDFRAKWDKKYKIIGEQWHSGWDLVSPLFKYPPEIRKVMYTTNAIESLNMVIRKSIKNRRIFPNDASAIKLVYLAIKQASMKWNKIVGWKVAMNFFAVHFKR